MTLQVFASGTPPFKPTRLALPTWTSGVGRPRRLFFTPTILARFISNYVNAYCTTPLGPINRGINFRPGDAANQCVVQALHFLAGGASDPALANSAAALARTVPFSTSYVGFTMYAEPAAFVLDWCGDAMTTDNRNALIAKIDANITAHIAAFTVNTPSCQVDQGEVTGRQNIPIGIMAIQGEAGATDRNLILRNYMQNWADCVNEGYGDGVFGSYMYEDSIIPQMILAYEIATGQDTGFLYNLSRADVVARTRVANPGHGITVVGGDQITNPLGLANSGNSSFGQDFAPYIAYALASHYNNGLWQWIGDTGISSGNMPNWAFESDSAMWLGVAMWDSTITGASPATSGLKKNKLWSTQNSANFRSGWTTQGSSCVDARAYLWSVKPQGHCQNFGGALIVHRGVDDLLPHGGTYTSGGGSARGYLEQDGAEGNLGWTVSSYAHGAINFSSFSASPDTDGQQLLCGNSSPITPAYAAYLASTREQYTPTNNNFNPSGTGRRGEIIYVDFPADESYGLVFQDISDQYPSTVATRVIRKVLAIPGASPGQLTLIVRDEFTLAPGVTQAVKWGWFSRQQPSVISSYAPVLRAGTVTAGITHYNGAAVGRTSAPTIISIRPASARSTIWDLNYGDTTHSNNLNIVGNAVAGATVAAYDGVTLLGSTTADVGGNWNIDTGVLTDAAHSFTATQTVSGVTSPASNAFALTVASSITSFNAASGGTSTVSTLVWTAINANKAWSLTNTDPHTLEFELRSGDAATNGQHQTTLQSNQLFGFSNGPFLTFEFMVTGSINDQFGAGKFFIFAEVHDTLSTTLRAPTLICLGGDAAPTAGGDQLAVDLGYGQISPSESATYVNRYSAPANLTRGVWHSVDMAVNPNNNAGNNITTAAITAYVDRAAVIVLPQGAVGTPIGYFNASPANSHYVRIGAYSSGGTQTQHVKFRNVLLKKFGQAIG